MIKKEMIAMLLAGGRGSRLGILTSKMAKPAVPFGGKYRIIDFPLSNCINSGVDTVGVLTQYMPLKLNTHIGIGIPWDLDKLTGGVSVLPPYEKIAGTEWYTGTANAIYQNMSYRENYHPEYVLILSGDHIYKMDYESMLKEYEGYADRLRPYVCDTIALLHDELKADRKILFEGAQATMLDIDYGTYPYVTASHPISGGIGVGAGVAPRDIDKVVGVVKAYCTRVGEGPFPTEQLNEIGDTIRDAGHEYGTVTGRPRRTGWLDACVVRYAGLLSGIDYMAITRLDILDCMDEIKMCVAYKYKGEIINEIPASLKVLAEVEPVYETFEGWKTDISGIRTYEELPEKARIYLERMAEVTGIDLGIVSVGPNRDQTIVLAKDLF